MGKVAVDLADHVIVTDDNPRSEDTDEIRRAIMAAAPGAIEIGGRREAIATAIAEAGADAIVLLAGKGHEQEKIVGDRIFTCRSEGHPSELTSLIGISYAVHLFKKNRKSHYHMK